MSGLSVIRTIMLAGLTTFMVGAASPPRAQDWTVTAEPRTLRNGTIICALLHGAGVDVQVYKTTAFVVVRSEEFVPLPRQQLAATVTFPSGATGRYVLTKQDDQENTIRFYPPTPEDLQGVINQFNQNGDLIVRVRGLMVTVALPDASRQARDMRQCMAELEPE